MFTVYSRKKGQYKVGDLRDIRERGMDWIDCFNPTEDEIKKIATILRLTGKQLNHLLAEDARSQAYSEKGFSLLAFSVPFENDEKEIEFSPLLVFLLRHETILTIRRRDLDIVHRLLEQLQKHPESMVTQGDFAYRLIEIINHKYDQYFENFETRISAIEDHVMASSLEDNVTEIFKMRKSIILLQRSLLPLREILGAIRMGMVDKLPKRDQLRFHFLFNDAIQMYDHADILREGIKSILEMRLSVQSKHLNVSVQKLSAWASLFLLPTLIASIYGMNFDTSNHLNMPELGWEYGYIFSIALMAVSTLALYIYFKKIDWI